MIPCKKLQFFNDIVMLRMVHLWILPTWTVTIIYFCWVCGIPQMVGTSRESADQANDTLILLIDFRKQMICCVCLIPKMNLLRN